MLQVDTISGMPVVLAGEPAALALLEHHSLEFTKVLRIHAFNAENTSSIGLNSGE